MGFKSAARFALALCIGAGIGLLSAHAHAQAGPPKSIVVATGVDSTFAHFVIAVKKGFFEKEGVKAELKPFNDGNFALDALLTGDADISGTSEVGGLSRMARGGKLYVVATGTQSEEFNAIVGKGSINSPKELEGKTVGMPGFASGANYFMRLAMEKYQIDPARINFKLLQAPESVAALSRGDIDAIAIWEPWPSRIMAAVPGSKVIVRSSKDLFPLTHYIYYSQRMIDDRDLAERSMRAIIGGAEWIDQHFDEATRIVAETYRLKYEDALPLMKLVRHNVTFSVEGFRKNFAGAAAFAKSVDIFKDVPNYENFLRPEILRAVAPDRVD